MGRIYRKKFEPHFWIFQLFEVKTCFVCFGLLILFSRRWQASISKSWSLPMSAPRKLRILAMFTSDRNRFLTRIWLWCCPFGICQVHFLVVLWWPKVFANTRSLKRANSTSLSPLSFVSSLQKGPQMPWEFSSAPLPTFAFQSPCTTRMPFFVSWSMTFSSYS